MRKSLLISGVVLAAGCLWLGLREWSIHRITLHAYYRQAQNVRKGTPVCVDGVELGSVTRVTVKPELGERPVEVVMKLGTPYQLQVPGGSIAQLESRGVLGPTIVDIDTRAAHGAPIPNGGSMDGRESADAQVSHALGVIVKAAIDQSKEDHNKGALPRKSEKPRK